MGGPQQRQKNHEKEKERKEALVRSGKHNIDTAEETKLFSIHDSRKYTSLVLVTEWISLQRRTRVLTARSDLDAQ